MIEDDVEAADRLAAVAAVAVAAVAADASARWLSVAQPPQPVQIQPHAVRLLPTAKLLDVRLCKTAIESTNMSEQPKRRLFSVSTHKTSNLQNDYN